MHLRVFYYFPINKIRIIHLIGKLLLTHLSDRTVCLECILIKRLRILGVTSLNVSCRYVRACDHAEAKHGVLQRYHQA